MDSNTNPQNPQTPVQPVAEPNPLQGAPVSAPTPLVVPTAEQPVVVTPLVVSDQAGIAAQTVPPLATPQNPPPASGLTPGPVSSPMTSMPPEGKKSNTMIIVLAILGILVAIAVFGGIYWYINNQNQAGVPSESSKANAQNAAEVSSLNQELQSLETLNVDTELVDVDRDLQSL